MSADVEGGANTSGKSLVPVVRRRVDRSKYGGGVDDPVSLLRRPQLRIESGYSEPPHLYDLKPSEIVLARRGNESRPLYVGRICHSQSELDAATTVRRCRYVGIRYGFVDKTKR